MNKLKNNKILLLENISQTAIEMFQSAGFNNIELVKTAISDEELLKKISDVSILGVRSKTKLPKEIFEAGKNLVAVGCFIVGVNKVDLKAAEKAGIPVFHGPFSSTRSVAELTIAFITSLFRKVHEKNLGAHEGKWLKKVDGREFRNKTLGIIGFSNIGSQVGLMAEALGMQVIFYDVSSVLPLGNAKKASSLDEVLENSDIITVHVPSLPSTKGMINKKTIKKMKKGAYLINTSRGDILNDQDVCEALDSGHLAGIAVDVYTKEPGSPEEPLESPFIKYPNALLTPHIGGSTLEAQEGIAKEVTTKLLEFLDTGKTSDAINFPKLNLPPNEGTHRILHIHENIPGMLSKINEAFAARKINISAQFLQTSQNIGYVVTDIDCDCSKEILQQIEQIPHTIKSYVIS